MTRKHFNSMAEEIASQINGGLHEGLEKEVIQEWCNWCCKWNRNFDTQRFTKYVEDRIWN